MPTEPNVKPFVPGAYEIRFQAKLGGDADVLNRLFFTFTGTMGATEATSIANNAGTQWDAYLKPLISAAYAMEVITVQDLGSATGVTQDVDHASTGTATGSATAAATSMLLVGAINRRYRGGKPRWYQGGLPQISLAGPQVWDPNVVTAWFNGFASFISHTHTFNTGALSTSGNVNLSYVNGHTWTVITLPSGQINYRRDPVYRLSVTPDPITAWSSQTVVASQRRRNRSG